MKRIYDAEIMKYIALLENIGKVRIRDLFLHNNMIVCVVDKSSVSILVGQEGKKIKKIQNMLNKKVKVIAYSDDVKDFVKDFIYPIKADSIEEDNEGLTIHCRDSRTKGLLIGRERRSLTDLQNVVSRYFKVESIKVK